MQTSVPKSTFVDMVLYLSIIRLFPFGNAAWEGCKKSQTHDFPDFVGPPPGN